MQSLPGNVFAAQQAGSFRQIVEAAFRHRKMWLFVVVSVVLVSIAYTLLRPRQYRSEMDILVQNTRADDQITPSRVNGEITVNGVTEEQINSEIQLLQSRSLANVVVDPNWNNKALTSLSPDQLRAHDKAVDDFEKHLTAELVRKSNVIHVSFVAGDPKSATDALNRLLAAFLEKQREIAQPPGTSKFFADEAARYKSELDQAQQQLADFQQKQQIVSLPDTEQNTDREINDAETDLRNTDAQISELTERIGEQTHQLKSIPTRQQTQQRTIPNEYSIEQLNTMMAQLQNQRTSLLTKFTPQDRLVQEINRKIADTKEALNNAEHMTSQEVSSDINPVWQTVTGSIIQSESDRQALKAKHEALGKQIASLRSSLSSTESSTVPFTTLRQKVTDLSNDYQLYSQKREEAEMADAMNQNQLLNVAVQQNPTYSIIPFRPRPVVDTVLGGFTALFLASFLVFFAEVGRETIANAGELERQTAFPVLATVPLARIGRGERGKLRSEFSPVIIEAGASAFVHSSNDDPALIRRQKERNMV